MKKKNIIAIAAVAVAGVASYFIRRKMNDRKRERTEPASGPNNRHLTDVFSKAKSGMTQEPVNP